MDFERYRTPRSVTEGVTLELPGTSGAEFVVALPSEHNRAFMAAQQRALVGKGKAQLGEDNELNFADFDAVEFQEARTKAFLDHCILKLPDGLTREMLAGEYYAGLQALFAQANDLAEDEKKAAAIATKKSKA